MCVRASPGGLRELSSLAVGRHEATGGTPAESPSRHALDSWQCAQLCTSLSLCVCTCTVHLVRPYVCSSRWRAFACTSSQLLLLEGAVNTQVHTF